MEEVRSMTSESANYLPLEIAGQIVALLRETNAQPGYRLTERTLAKEFDVSRSPVRAALNFLADEGVIETREGGGRFLIMRPNELAEYEIEAPANPLSELYHNLITEQISGTLPEHFTEADLLRKYDVSRGVLTKALGKMAADGLIDRRQGHGWRCLPIINTMEANLKSYEYRLAIEPALLLSDNFCVVEERLERCYRTQKEMAQGGLAKLTASQVFEANAEVHQMLADFSGNDFFQEAIRKQNQLRLIMENRAAKHSERMVDSCFEHMAILEAVGNGRLATASRLMASHLTQASQSFYGLDKLERK